MPKVRVEYEHDVCVGTAACSAADPKHFEMLDDGKSHIIDSKMIMTAAQACPVNAIHVFVDGQKKI